MQASLYLVTFFLQWKFELVNYFKWIRDLDCMITNMFEQTVWTPDSQFSPNKGCRKLCNHIWSAEKINIFYGLYLRGRRSLLPKTMFSVLKYCNKQWWISLIVSSIISLQYYLLLLSLIACTCKHKIIILILVLLSLRGLNIPLKYICIEQ